MRRRRKARYVFIALAAPAAALAAGLALGACDEPEREGDPRFYIPPDGPEEDADADATVMPGRDSSVDSSSDADAEAGDGGDGGLLVIRAIATGSSEQPLGFIGNGDHTCVIAGTTRALYCWGANDHGQLGNGKTGAADAGDAGDGEAGGPAIGEDVATATKILVDETGLPFEGLEEVSLAGYHSCARKGDVLFCWGQRFTGAQAEPPASNPDRTAPRAIGNFDVARVGTGGPHTCALKTNGKIACFGHSTFNELGRPNGMDLPCTAPFFYDYNDAGAHVCSGQLVEVTFAALPATLRVVAGETHSCALTGTKVACWGSTANGALGRPVAGASELNAQTVVTDPGLLTALDGVTAIANDGAQHTCALRATGVVCWGLNDKGQIAADPNAVPQRPFAGPAAAGTGGAVAIGVADRVSCAVKADATVLCWGADLAALGDGGTASSFVPVAIKGPLGVGLLTNVEAIAPGARHACALKKDGTVWCWGKNDRGQLGDGTKVDSPYPVKVTGLPP